MHEDREGIYNIWNEDRGELAFLVWVDERLATPVYEHLCNELPAETFTIVTKN